MQVIGKVRPEWQADELSSRVELIAGDWFDAGAFMWVVVYTRVQVCKCALLCICARAAHADAYVRGAGRGGGSVKRECLHACKSAYENDHFIGSHPERMVV